MSAPLDVEIDGRRRWWLGEDGQVEGPYGASYIVVAIKTGKLTPNVLACLVGTQEWRAVADWPEFRPIGASIPPPLPTQNRPTAPVVYAEFWDRVRALFLDGIIFFLFTQANRYWLWQFGDLGTNEAGVDLFYMIVTCPPLTESGCRVINCGILDH
jgi:GYF domain 2